ncbi:MAG: DNA-directed RNA polymerase subunit N [Candidatus Aenigmarchaeota archaeon]|nr:DNA-directed RNA polymerase subunit N [Candidatus Aenigmarchaeota archaeon]MCX8190825.1 DNA-directed RNA polymerase subunit N [Candidatus Aenigmarchaeota archaeon]MDW8160074.1 DNA-directed RNA polymerase subunit N [Candidatus Aenigmarchaeota archaeon]
MLFPIRCFTCGKVIAHLWEEYKKRVEKGEDPAKILDELNVKRYCCRRIFLTHVEIFEKIARFKP